MKQRTALYCVSDYLCPDGLDDAAYFNLILDFAVSQTVQSQAKTELRYVKLLFVVGLANVPAHKWKDALHKLLVFRIVASKLLMCVHCP